MPIIFFINLILKNIFNIIFYIVFNFNYFTSTKVKSTVRGGGQRHFSALLCDSAVLRDDDHALPVQMQRGSLLLERFEELLQRPDAPQWRVADSAKDKFKLECARGSASVVELIRQMLTRRIYETLENKL